MKKLINQMVLGAAFLGVGLLGVAPQAQAISYTFNLDCVFGGAGVCTTGGTYGTVKVEDDGANQVKVTVDTTATKVGSKNFFVGLNTSGVAVTGASVLAPDLLDGFTYSANSIAADGYCSVGAGGCFDVGVDIKSNASTTPVVINLTGAGLDATDFLQKDNLYNKLFAGVHVGNADAQGNSLWVGGSHDPYTRVPEPSTVMLLGSGLVGLRILRRKSTK